VSIELWLLTCCPNITLTSVGLVLTRSGIAASECRAGGLFMSRRDSPGTCPFSLPVVIRCGSYLLLPSEATDWVGRPPRCPDRALQSRTYIPQLIVAQPRLLLAVRELQESSWIDSEAAANHLLYCYVTRQVSLVNYVKLSYVLQHICIDI
jgi:hypothetical protein